jgi:hypothetical protein
MAREVARRRIVSGAEVRMSVRSREVVDPPAVLAFVRRAQVKRRRVAKERGVVVVRFRTVAG